MAVFGLGTNGAAVAAVLGAVNVVLCWVMLLGVTPRRSAALLGTLFYGFGTVAWYAAMLGTTWFLAHVVASTFLFLAIGVAVRADREALRARIAGHGRGLRRQFLAGLLFGMAGLARLTTLFGAPFFVFVGGGGTWLRRGMAAGAAALVPVLLLLALQRGHHGPPLPPRLRAPLPRRVPAAPGDGQPRLGHRGPALHPAERRRHAGAGHRNARCSTIRPARVGRSTSARSSTATARSCGPTRWA